MQLKAAIVYIRLYQVSDLFYASGGAGGGTVLEFKMSKYSKAPEECIRSERVSARGKV